jgi:hypothetical protein
MSRILQRSGPWGLIPLRIFSDIQFARGGPDSRAWSTIAGPADRAASVPCRATGRPGEHLSAAALGGPIVGTVANRGRLVDGPRLGSASTPVDCI